VVIGCAFDIPQRICYHIGNIPGLFRRTPMNIMGKRNLRKVLEHRVRTQPDRTFLVYEDGNRRRPA
jgi:hypothetical protein